MSLWADQQIKELRAEVTQLRKEMDELKRASEPPRVDWMGSLKAAYQDKFGKAPHHLLKPETIAERLK